MTNTLNPSSQRTYEQVFQHPISHNLEWRNLRTLFDELGEVEEERNGRLKVTLGGHSLVFQLVKDSDVVSAEEIERIRHLIRGSEDVAVQSGSGEHLLVVMDHSEARVFRTQMKGAVPEMVTPYDPEGFESHVHSSHDYAGPAEKQNSDAYFRQIAKSIKGAQKILIFGSGTGSSSAMDNFVAWLAVHHKEVSERVLAAVTVDLGHLSDGQLLTKAREVYSGV